MSNVKSVVADTHSDHHSNTEYFAQRKLKQGAVGWLLLIGLGVAYVISGDFDHATYSGRRL